MVGQGKGVLRRKEELTPPKLMVNSRRCIKVLDPAHKYQGEYK